MKGKKKQHSESEQIVPDDETLQDETEMAEEEESARAQIRKLKEQIKQLQHEKTQYLDELQRAKAEFLNGKKRLEEEKVRDRQRAASEHIQHLLPLYDSFTTALSGEHWEKMDEKWRKGIESIYGQLQSIFKTYGITTIRPEGEAFDPQLQEAVSTVSVDHESKHHVVMSVIQDGFIRNTNGNTELIRPARVAIGEFTN